MNIRFYKTVGTFWGILCLSLPSLAQEPQIRKPERYSFLDSKLKPGQFTIDRQKDGHVVVEMHEAPLEPVLQAIARLANRQLIISDDAKKKLQTQTGNTLKLTSPSIDGAFTFLTRGFSWGKLGKDAYLLVPRTKSEAEVIAEEAEQDKLKNKWQAPPSQKSKQGPAEPQQDTLPNPFRLLSPNTQQNK